MSLRSTSRQTASSTAMALVWCGVWSSMEAKPKKSPCRRLVHHHFLLVLVHGGHPDLARDHDVGPAARVADFVDALPRGETA